MNLGLRTILLVAEHEFAPEPEFEEPEFAAETELVAVPEPEPEFEPEAEPVVDSDEVEALRAELAEARAELAHLQEVLADSMTALAALTAEAAGEPYTGE